jgi:hypothetical protein
MILLDSHRFRASLVGITPLVRAAARYRNVNGSRFDGCYCLVFLPRRDGRHGRNDGGLMIHFAILS